MLSPPAMGELFEAVLKAEREGDPAALLTVVSSRGSTPQKPGTKMVVFADGRTVGTIGGGCVEADMARRARQVIESGRAELADYDLTPEQAGEDGLICGGRMQVFIEPIEATPTLCLFGAGHVAQPLCQMAKLAGFRVEVVDDRVKFANAERFPDADRIVVDGFAAGAEQMTLNCTSFAVVVTRGHKGDLEALGSVVAKGLRYVGLVGSKAKMSLLFATLADRGLRPEDLAQVQVPVGLRIGATTPAEIAVSILAEMIAVRHGVDPTTTGSLKIDLPARLKRQ